jgi:hypothetical protein
MTHQLAVFLASSSTVLPQSAGRAAALRWRFPVDIWGQMRVRAARWGITAPLWGRRRAGKASIHHFQAVGRERLSHLP